MKRIAYYGYYMDTLYLKMLVVFDGTHAIGAKCEVLMTPLGYHCTTVWYVIGHISLV